MNETPPTDHTTPTDDTVQTPSAPPTPQPPTRTVRMRTVVTGLVLLGIAISVLLAILTPLTIDPFAVLIALMAGGGALLIVGARRSWGE